MHVVRGVYMLHAWRIMHAFGTFYMHVTCMLEIHKTYACCVRVVNMHTTCAKHAPCMHPTGFEHEPDMHSILGNMHVTGGFVAW